MSFVDEISNPNLVALYEFWRESSDADSFPSQRDLNLSDIPKLLPNCWFLDVLPDRKFRYRFMGTDIDRHLGVSVTGKMVHEFRKGQILETMTEFMGNVAETGNPGYCETRMSTEKKSELIYMRLALPVADDHVNVNKLFGGWYYTPIGDWNLTDSKFSGMNNTETALVRIVYDTN